MYALVYFFQENISLQGSTEIPLILTCGKNNSFPEIFLASYMIHGQIYKLMYCLQQHHYQENAQLPWA
jgi:hypothetical protein